MDKNILAISYVWQVVDNFWSYPKQTLTMTNHDEYVNCEICK